MCAKNKTPVNLVLAPCVPIAYRRDTLPSQTKHHILPAKYPNRASTTVSARIISQEIAMLRVEESALVMCQKFLSAKDLNEICKYRRFANPPKDKDRLAEFVARRLPGSDGVQAALDSLEDKGKKILFLISHTRKEPTLRDLSLNLRLILQGNLRDYIDDKRIFAELNSELLNRGLIIIEDTNYKDHSQESRYSRFKLNLLDHVQTPSFPAEYKKFQANPHPQQRTDTYFMQALGAAGGEIPAISPKGKLYSRMVKSAGVVADRLCLATFPVDTLDSLNERIRELWISIYSETSQRPANDFVLSTPDESFRWAYQILRSVPHGMGISPPNLLSALEILVASPPKLDAIQQFLEDGQSSGLLSVDTKSNEKIYRVAPAESTGKEDELHSQELECQDNETTTRIRIDLAHTSFQSLINLGQFCKLSFDSGSLYLIPDTSRMLKWFSTKGSEAWAMGRTRSQIFDRTCNLVETNFGKVILHEKVLIMRIDDIGIRALIKHNFGENVREIVEPYMVAPESLSSQIEALIRKQGYAPRWRTT